MKNRILITISLIFGFILLFYEMDYAIYAAPTENTDKTKNETADCDAFVDSYFKDKKDKYYYNDYCPEDYRLEIFIKDVIGPDKPERNFTESTNWIMDFIWRAYVKFIYLVMGLLELAVTLDIMDYIYNMYESLIGLMRPSILDHLYFFMSAIALAWVTYYWVVNKKTKMWKALVNIIVIQALILLFFNTKSVFGLPNILSKSIDISTGMSTFIFRGFDDLAPSWKCGENTVTKPTNEDEIFNYKKEALFCTLILEPYQIINFGTVEKATIKSSYEGGEDLEGNPEKFENMPTWEIIVAAETELTRDGYIQCGYEGEKAEKGCQASGKSINNRFFRLTGDGYLFKFIPLTIFVLVGGFLGAVIFYLCYSIIVWQLRAIGRGIVGVFFLVISLWPEYGLRESVKWFWSMILAIFMKFIFSLALALLFGVMLSIKYMEDFSQLMQLIFLIGLMYGLWQAAKDLRSTVQKVPVENEFTLDGITNKVNIYREKNQ